jgi:hypothetical protein
MGLHHLEGTGMSEMKIVKVPMLDTGIGREAGYANDRELIDAYEAQRAALSNAERQMLDEWARRETLAFVNGTSREGGT